MFTRAGFNPRCRRGILFAIVHVRGAGLFRGELIRFVPSNDYAWHTGGGHFSWPHQVDIYSLKALEPNAPIRARCEVPQ